MNVDEALRRLPIRLRFRAKRCSGPWTIGTRRRRDSSRNCAPTPPAQSLPISIPIRSFSSFISAARNTTSRLHAALQSDRERCGDRRLARRRVTANLKGILINVCDGDVEPLKRAIESEAGDEYARAAAIEALAYLVRASGSSLTTRCETTFSGSARRCCRAKKLGFGSLGPSPLLGSAMRRCAQMSRGFSRRAGSKAGGQPR